jgi:hypothetical protein
MEHYLNGLGTRDWRIDLYLDDLPPEGIDFYQTDRPFPEPDRARKARMETWEMLLKQTKSRNEADKPECSYEIKDDEKTGNLALFQTKPEERIIQFDGKTINMANYHQEGRLFVGVYPIDWSEWMACMNPDFTKAYLEDVGKKPYAGVGVNIFTITSDGFVPLTLRDIETPNYPWRLFNFGGGPKPGEKSSEAVLLEAAAESGIRKENMGSVHPGPPRLSWIALVSDKKWMGSEHERPDFTAVVDIKPSFRELAEAHHLKTRDMRKKETGIKTIIPVHLSLPGIDDFIFSDGYRMCPPTEAGLSLLSYKLREMRSGPEEAQRAFSENAEKIDRYERGEVFIPRPLH